MREEKEKEIGRKELNKRKRPTKAADMARKIRPQGEE